MTGNNVLFKKCDICGAILQDGEKDIQELSKPYELPYEIKWNGIECNITNKVVRHICQYCTEKIIDTMKGLMSLNLGE